MLVLIGKHGEITGDGSRPTIFRGQDPVTEMQNVLRSSHWEKMKVLPYGHQEPWSMVSIWFLVCF